MCWVRFSGRKTLRLQGPQVYQEVLLGAAAGRGKEIRMEKREKLAGGLGERFSAGGLY